MKKFSKQKLAIFNAVKSVACHPTADDIYSWLKPKYPALSLGTVYRNLNMLVEFGEILRLPVAGQSDHFDGNTAPHEHAICRLCGTMFDVDLPELRVLHKKIQQQIAMEVESYEYLARGVCSSCNQQKTALNEYGYGNKATSD
jgi:Fur family peroxide stress response transcriptional regulator